MSFGFSPNRRAGVTNEAHAQDPPSYAVPNSGSSHGFLIFSALIHIAAVVVLMRAWSGGLPRANGETNTASNAPEQPTAPRLSIDVAPVQYREMEIEKIVSRPQVESVR